MKGPPGEGCLNSMNFQPFHLLDSNIDYLYEYWVWHEDPPEEIHGYDGWGHQGKLQRKSIPILAPISLTFKKHIYKESLHPYHTQFEGLRKILCDQEDITQKVGSKS